jgi:pimeloyl-ACP methyl ester carboxylesterase
MPLGRRPDWSTVMLDFSGPARLVAQHAPGTAFFRGLVRVLSTTPVSLDPSKALLAPGAAAGYNVRDVSIPLGDHHTPGRLFTPKVATGASVIIAHGTTAEGAVPYYMWIRAMLEGGLTVLTFELDGHGGNPRWLTCPAIEENVPAAIAFLRDQPGVDPDRVGLLGVSLGGACALNAAAADKDVKAVVTVGSPYTLSIDEWGKLGEALGLFNPEIWPTYVEATPDTLLAFMQSHLRVGPEIAEENGDMLAPATRVAVQAALRHLNPLDSVMTAGHAPLLVINGEWDFISPPWQAYDLYERAAGPKALAIVPRRNHFTIMISRTAVESTAAWFRRWL